MSTTYRSCAEDAAEIRQTLKRQHGWTSRQVSVRAETYSMGSSIHVEIKDVAIPLPVVTEIAELAESIRRDGWGEILSGGNRFVHVRYSRDAERILEARYADPVRRASDMLAPDNDRSLERVEGTPFLVGRPMPGRLTLWDEDAGCIATSYTVESIAGTIAQLMIARKLVK